VIILNAQQLANYLYFAIKGSTSGLREIYLTNEYFREDILKKNLPHDVLYEMNITDGATWDTALLIARDMLIKE
jgi:hypothetical protein